MFLAMAERRITSSFIATHVCLALQRYEHHNPRPGSPCANFHAITLLRLGHSADDASRRTPTSGCSCSQMALVSSQQITTVGDLRACEDVVLQEGFMLQSQYMGPRHTIELCYGKYQRRGSKPTGRAAWVGKMGSLEGHSRLLERILEQSIDRTADSITSRTRPLRYLRRSANASTHRHLPPWPETSMTRPSKQCCSRPSSANAMKRCAK